METGNYTSSNMEADTHTSEEQRPQGPGKHLHNYSSNGHGNRIKMSCCLQKFNVKVDGTDRVIDGGNRRKVQSYRIRVPNYERSPEARSPIFKVFLGFLSTSTPLSAFNRSRKNGNPESLQSSEQWTSC